MAENRKSSDVVEHSVFNPFPLTAFQHDTGPTTISFDKWIDSILDSSASPTVDLSRFGLKTARDVKLFLSSPAGESVLSEMGAQLALEDSIQGNQRRQNYEQQVLTHRLQGLLLLWFMTKEANAAAEIKELTLEQNQKATEKNQTKNTSSDTQNEKSSKQYEKAIVTYDRALIIAQEKESTLEVKSTELRDDLTTLQKQADDIETKYDSYLKRVNDFSILVDDLNPTQISEIIESVSAEMEKHLASIERSIVHDKEAEAMAMKNIMIGLNLKVATLKDMMAVREGRKYYADANGINVPFMQAHYILENTQKIVLDPTDNQLYLLNRDQDLNLMKVQEPDALKKAQANYERNKSMIMTVRNVVVYNKDLEKGDHQLRVNQANKKLVDNQAERLLVTNQINLLQSARANAQNELNQFTASNDIPRPTPTAGKATTPKPSQSGATLFYREHIKQLKENHIQVTFNDIFALIASAPGNRTIANAFMIRLLANRPRSAPLMPQDMQALLRNLPRFGIDATKPSVTSIQTDMDLADESKSTTPTPFCTKPKFRK